MSFTVSEKQNCYKRPVSDLGREADKEFSYNTQILGKAKIKFFSTRTEFKIHFDYHMELTGRDMLETWLRVLLYLFLPSFHSISHYAQLDNPSPASPNKLHNPFSNINSFTDKIG